MAMVCIVDDDSIFQFTATRMIQSGQLSNSIIQFENGGEALNYLKANAQEAEKLPDFLFLDINMPIVDGWMFLDEFALLKTSLAKEILIYMVSSSIDPRDFNRAKAIVEIKDFVIKPLTMQRFTELLKSA